MAQLPAGAVSFDGTKQRLLRVGIAPVEKNAVTRTIRVVGCVASEDTRTYRINSGVDGFIREIHDDSVGMQVKENDEVGFNSGPLCDMRPLREVPRITGI